MDTVSRKRVDAEKKHLFLQFHQQQTEDQNDPARGSADQTTAEIGGGAETSRNPDVNVHEQISDSTESEISGDDDDANLDSELSDPGSETRDEDSDWNERRASESDVKTINKSFSCPECGKQFLHKSSLQKHVRVTNHPAIRSSGCLANKKCVRGKQNVDSCRKVQTELKSFCCDDCGKRFCTKSILNSHIKVHTGQKPFACELCGQEFSQKSSLKTHMRVHTGQKPHACDHCGKRFSHKTTLNSHMSVHTGQKPFPCELCGQRFNQKTHLNSHMRVHTGQKPHACELCGQRFSQKTTFNSHMRVHTGKKPFACELCGRKFSRSTQLTSHMRVHTGQKPFVCELCAERFSCRSSLNSHMRIHTRHKDLI